MRLVTAVLLTSFAVAASAGHAAAQTATLPYDHVHLAAPDQAKAVEWYQKMFGGQTTPEGKDRLLFGTTRFIWLNPRRHSRARTRPSTTSRSRSPIVHRSSSGIPGV
jgi:catechol-2,3-dioxygenase